jgi:hypothetical protein
MLKAQAEGGGARRLDREAAKGARSSRSTKVTNSDAAADLLRGCAPRGFAGLRVFVLPTPLYPARACSNSATSLA